MLRSIEVNHIINLLGLAYMGVGPCPCCGMNALLHGVPNYKRMYGPKVMLAHTYGGKYVKLHLVEAPDV